MNFQTKRIITIIGLFSFLITLSSGYADTGEDGSPNILYSISLNPVGSGARALGMGGAFISIADDATAASWNPAGLVQLKRPEFSVVGSFVSRSEGFKSINNFGTLEDETVEMSDLNYLSVVIPFSLVNRNMAVSLNYQHLYDYTSKGKFSDETYSIKRDLKGSLSPIGLSYSLQITPKFKWGVTFNFWNRFFDENRLQETYRITYKFQGIAIEDHAEKEHRMDGFNINTGLLWHISENTGIGLVFKTPFELDINATGGEKKTLLSGNESTSAKEFKMPLSFGVGGHFKFTDNFKISMDIYQTNWNRYDCIDENDNRYSAVTGLLQNETHVEPTRQVRAGMEYLIIRQEYNRSYPIRTGVFYDPIPDKGSPVDVYGGSIGTGISTRSFAIDGFYQYKFSTNHSSMDTAKAFFPETVQEHQVYLSFIYYL